MPPVHRRRRVTKQRDGNRPVPAEYGGMGPLSASALLADALGHRLRRPSLNPAPLRSYQGRDQLLETP